MGLSESLSRQITRLNFAIADSWIGVWFKLDDGRSLGRRTGAVFTTELRAGLTTFAAMAYIISVNASIISATGGTCVCDSTPSDPHCMSNAPYAACKEIVRRDLITSTAAAACIASFLMGAFANLPVGLAPGLGLNAYFTYSVVGLNGSGRITYQEALAAVFLEGWVFFILSILGIRIWLARLIPRSLTLAVGAGIGLFIALIGLSPQGLGVVGGDYSNILGLGGCPPEFQDPEHSIFCLSHVLQSPRMWIGIFLGGIVTVLMMMYRVRGAIIMGIFFVSVCAWPRNSAVTLFPHTEAGDNAYDYFKQVVGFYPLRMIGNAADYNYRSGRVWQALVTFLYVDLFDTTGTLYAMAKFSGLVDPATKDFERSTVAYCVDAISISMGSLLGTSPVTAFIESATGISDGGKTGLTAISVSFWFLVSVFFAPIFASIPDYATGGALVICGCLMIRNVADINWRYTGDAIPAFLTLIVIPFTYNIAYGLIAGIVSFCVLNGFAWLMDTMSGGRLTPAGYYTDREDWAFPQGSFVPFWIPKLLRGDPRFWVSDAEASGELSYFDRQRQLELQMGAQHHVMVENPHAGKFRDSATTESDSALNFDGALESRGTGRTRHTVVDLEGYGKGVGMMDRDKEHVQVSINDAETSSEDRSRDEEAYKDRLRRERQATFMERRASWRGTGGINGSTMDVTVAATGVGAGAYPMQNLSPPEVPSIRARSTERGGHQPRRDELLPTSSPPITPSSPRYHQRQRTR